MNMEIENQAKFDSFKFQPSDTVLKDNSVLEKVFPGIKHIDMSLVAKGVKAWGGLAYIGGVDLNAIIFVFIGDDNSVQVRLQYNSSKLNASTREEIVNSIVDVIKS